MHPLLSSVALPRALAPSFTRMSVRSPLQSVLLPMHPLDPSFTTNACPLPSTQRPMQRPRPHFSSLQLVASPALCRHSCRFFTPASSAAAAAATSKRDTPNASTDELDDSSLPPLPTSAEAQERRIAELREEIHKRQQKYAVRVCRESNSCLFSACNNISPYLSLLTPLCCAICVRSIMHRKHRRVP